ncbi:MAG: uracil phosphoribosyltransferase [Paludibacteraceae bacterium]|nr:uracil phosphoribosyltransferase [Paludibacteraceae bacterium]
MEIHNLSEHNSLLNQFMKEIRDVNIQRDRMRFRRNLERIGEIMALEISKTLSYKAEDVQTPLATASVNTLQDKIVLGTIFRAGLPLYQGFLNMFDDAENAFVSAYRSYKDEAHTEIEIHREYMAAPDLNGKTLILVDPMLATGGSMDASYKALLANGQPKRTELVCAIATPMAISFLQSTMPQNVTLWCGAIDPVLNEHKYIIPGLGDAGDLCYGEKL